MRPRGPRPIRTASQLERALRLGGVISDRGGRTHLGLPEYAGCSPTIYRRASAGFFSSLAHGDESQRSRLSDWEYVDDDWMIRRIGREPDPDRLASITYRGEQVQTHDGPG